MTSKNRTYIAIDLKSFYASVECVARGLDPLSARLVVADESRTDKTICLAVSPALKRLGIPGRPRLFEVNQKARGIDFIIAKPRMARYIEVSCQIYDIYLKYVSSDDIHVYSIDEVFMDVTDYLATYRKTAHELAITMIRDVLRQTGITATAGIGTNMYLAKVAMDIVAKKMPADKDGVRIAELDEMSYRRTLWNHFPITDFWRVGHGIAEKLARYGLDTMGKVARQSVTDEELLYRLFGVNAELLIDHAWGWEPCTIDLVKAYRPETRSMSSGQVLSEPYTFEKARNVVMEMADAISLDLVEKRLLTDQLVLTVSYDRECLTRPEIASTYHGEIVNDYYGRPVPKHAHGTANLARHSSSSREIVGAVMSLYDSIVGRNLLIRRLNISTNHVVRESQQTAEESRRATGPQQLDLFVDYESAREEEQRQQSDREKERRMQEALIGIKKRFGKNAILRGTSYAEGATAKERNEQIGGHKA
ncbi:MAG: DNA methylase [Bacteroidaceae bacterium]|nr:DNA methylase [Bacteroidaceae bacterium]